MKQGAWIGALVGGLVLGGIAQAQAPQTSLRPMPRPVLILLDPNATLAPFSSLRPVPRGGRPVQTVVQTVVVEQAISADLARQNSVGQPNVFAAVSPFAVARSLMPRHRPKGLQRVARVDPAIGKVGKAVRYRKKGSVCGIKGIRGYAVGRVQGKIAGCSIKNPVKINEVDGVKFTREVLVGCEAAQSLYGWVRKSAKPVMGRKGGGLAKIQMIAGYSCRNRNSAKSGKLSEHAKGKAIDIAGFVLKDGTILSVKRDWHSANKGRTLKKLHKTACGPFGTVLGPNANRYHRDHFHFDVARYRSGAYCR